MIYMTIISIKSPTCASKATHAAYYYYAKNLLNHPQTTAKLSVFQLNFNNDSKCHPLDQQSRVIRTPKASTPARRQVENT